MEVLSSLYRCLLQSVARNKCLTKWACCTCERLRKHHRILLSHFVLLSHVDAFSAEAIEYMDFTFRPVNQNSGKKIMALIGAAGSVSMHNVLFAVK